MHICSFKNAHFYSSIFFNNWTKSNFTPFPYLVFTDIHNPHPRSNKEKKEVYADKWAYSTLA